MWSSFHLDGVSLTPGELEAEASKILARVDRNADGVLGFAEFEEYFRRTCKSIAKFRKSKAGASRPTPSRQDAAASKITAGVKGLHTRKQLKAGNVERFKDGDRERKIEKRKQAQNQQRSAPLQPRASPPLPLDAHMAIASLLHTGRIKCAAHSHC